MNFTSIIHKYYRDFRNKKDRPLAKMQSDDKNSKHDTIEPFLARALPEKEC